MARPLYPVISRYPDSADGTVLARPRHCDRAFPIGNPRLQPGVHLLRIDCRLDHESEGSAGAPIRHSTGYAAPLVGDDQRRPGVNVKALASSRVVAPPRSTTLPLECASTEPSPARSRYSITSVPSSSCIESQSHPCLRRLEKARPELVIHPARAFDFEARAINRHRPTRRHARQRIVVRGIAGQRALPAIPAVAVEDRGPASASKRSSAERGRGRRCPKVMPAPVRLDAPIVEPHAIPVDAGACPAYAGTTELLGRAMPLPRHVRDREVRHEQISHGPPRWIRGAGSTPIRKNVSW